ncbi:MAG TPA: hypothetical protein ENK18_24380 [Deltaproteobacteria bacterium]|nr:hypothetical protein [Deltaproteobacteria bacterium]
MFGRSRGLLAVSEADLITLLRELHRDTLGCPITPGALAEVGLLRLSDDLEHLRSLDRAAVIATLVAVIAERRAAHRAQAR